MKTVIDELSLKIDIRTKKDIDKTISSIASAINKLNKAVSNVSALKKYVNTLNSLTRRTFKVADGTKQGKQKGQAESVAPETEEVANANQIADANKEIADSKQKATQLTKEQRKEQEKLLKEQKKQEKNEQDLYKKSKKIASPLAKMIKSIGRIALYRAARFALTQIVQGAAQGLENIRSVDTELDTSMKKMSQSYTTLKNSFASLFAPIIETIEPIITKIADTIGGWVNGLNEAKAALSGATTYTKILTSDSTEYKENLEKANEALLEFDKFSSLNKDKESYTGTVKAEVDMSKEEAQGVVNLWNGIEVAIWGVVAAIGALVATNLIKKFDKLSKSLKSLKADTKEATDTIDSMKQSSSALAITGITVLAGGILSLISNWKEMGSVGKWLVPIISVLTGVIVALAMGLHFAKNQWGKALSIGALVTGTGLSVGSALSAAIGFKDGGTPKQGTYFYAGEAGAEIVANTSGGKTGVTNISQFKTAMVEALAEYGVARNGKNSDTVLQVNGKEFARATATDMASVLSKKYRVDFQPR